MWQCRCAPFFSQMLHLCRREVLSDCAGVMTEFLSLTYLSATKPFCMFCLYFRFFCAQQHNEVVQVSSSLPSSEPQAGAFRRVHFFLLLFDNTE